MFRAERELRPLFAMVGDTDYQVDGQADFVVSEDLGKSGGEAGRFPLFVWEDIPIDDGVPKSGDGLATEQNSWAAVKALFL